MSRYKLGIYFLSIFLSLALFLSGCSSDKDKNKKQSGLSVKALSSASFSTKSVQSLASPNNLDNTPNIPNTNDKQQRNTAIEEPTSSAVVVPLPPQSDQTSSSQVVVGLSPNAGAMLSSTVNNMAKIAASDEDSDQNKISEDKVPDELAESSDSPKTTVRPKVDINDFNNMAVPVNFNGSAMDLSDDNSDLTSTNVSATEQTPTK